MCSIMCRVHPLDAAHVDIIVGSPTKIVGGWPGWAVVAAVVVLVGPPVMLGADGSTTGETGAGHPSAAECSAELATISGEGQLCTCDGNATVCSYTCPIEVGGKVIPSGCRNGIVAEPCALSCPTIEPTNPAQEGSAKTFVVEYVRPNSCQSLSPCSECQPVCMTGYFWYGPPLWCGAWSNWTGVGQCRYLGVHRVGVGLWALDVGNINLQGGAFDIDFMLTVRTEQYAFESRDAAVATFGSDLARDCSPRLNTTRTNGTPTAALGSGTLNRQGDPNSAPFLSPTQFILAAQLNADISSIMTVENLGMSFFTIPKPTIKQITFESGDLQHAQIYYRVTGTGHFKPQLRDWPYDTQRLEVQMEDLDFAVSRDEVGFVFCSLVNYTGLSPSVHLAGGEKQLSNGVEVTEMCWPPFQQPFDSASSSGTERSPLTMVSGSNEAHQTCQLHQGAYLSSRYTFFIEYTNPWVQQFTKAYLPVCFANFILAMSYLLPAKDYNQRISICIGTLTVLVLFHVALETQLPSSQTVTLVGWLLLYSYAMNLATWTVVSALMLLHHADHRWETKVHRMARCCGPAVITAVTITLCALRGKDYAAGGGDAGGKIAGAVIGALVLGYAISRLEDSARARYALGSVGEECAARQQGEPHPTDDVEMETRFGSPSGATGRREQEIYENEDDDDMLLLKEGHAD